MKQNYVKPFARNLGDIPEAEGYCLTVGSSAHTTGNPDCQPGNVAIGAYCTTGGGPDTKVFAACQSGITPGFNGCAVGFGNASSCSLGNTP
jgi:hypothetical protein